MLVTVPIHNIMVMVSYGYFQLLASPHPNKSFNHHLPFQAIDYVGSEPKISARSTHPGNTPESVEWNFREMIQTSSPLYPPPP
jgi:hypothetical protein